MSVLAEHLRNSANTLIIPAAVLPGLLARLAQDGF
jgi:hypothetical protein